MVEAEDFVIVQMAPFRNILQLPQLMTLLFLLMCAALFCGPCGIFVLVYHILLRRASESLRTNYWVVQDAYNALAQPVFMLALLLCIRLVLLEAPLTLPEL